jgi:hypothetical protein
VLTARYAKSLYIKEIDFVFKGLTKKLLSTDFLMKLTGTQIGKKLLTCTLPEGSQPCWKEHATELYSDDVKLILTS